MTQVIPLKEAAKYLHISPSLLWRLATQGKISYLRINKRFFFTEEQLQDFMKTVTVERSRT